MPTVETITHPDNTPEVRAMRERMAPLQTRLDELERQQREYNRVLDARVRQHDFQGEVPRDLILDAEAHEPEVRRERAAVELQLRALEAEYARLRQAAREKLRDVLTIRLARDLKALAKALRAVRPLNDAAMLTEQLLHEQTGVPIEGWAWVQLGPSTNTQLTKFDDWLGRVTERFGDL